VQKYVHLYLFNSLPKIIEKHLHTHTHTLKHTMHTDAKWAWALLVKYELCACSNRFVVVVTLNSYLVLAFSLSLSLTLH